MVPNPPLPPLPPQPRGPDPVEVARGRCFQFAMPVGWRVLEEGQFAVVTAAPDNTAVTLMVGNTGAPTGYPPMQYAYERVAGLRGQNLWLGPPRPGRPMAGFPGAWDADCTYGVNGVPCRGLATMHVRPGYDWVDLVLTFAAAQEPYWPRYASWLPQVAAQVAPTDGSAWGARAFAQQNLNNSVALGQQWHQYLDWSNNLQQQVAAGRARSDAVRNHGMGEVLTGRAWFDHPYGYAPQQLQTTAAVHWAHRDGRVLTSDDPNFDPRTPADPDWQPMRPQGPG